MGSQYRINELVLSGMQYFPGNEKYARQIAPPGHMLFITDGPWLKHAAVIDEMSSRQGVWDICSFFVHYKNLLQLIVWEITLAN